ncbi:hypothetical protein DL89DRAFT_18321 [Linderina pennispora]|uniref:Uncharacterized protein n=1 Tax=Linderina pennispora TaxID=61395 RepID=A0A1Y1WLS4_9FUNG|nr:uncharacterized protein DL89DRAFT_18321 [Linderina pennispora]ORX74520.1 hypothetical protein DL89DRAFT_18321 [Linderina pennispora]
MTRKQILTPNKYSHTVPGGDKCPSSSRPVTCMHALMLCIVILCRPSIGPASSTFLKEEEGAEEKCPPGEISGPG